ncbi:MAG: hydantoinase B/oxoprolinase family protein, partial [Kangiellaceae bacterium]|nr:hydantoinase B/oxoprolinase family protein [Kangiellaceae bacterium]
MADWSFWVDRGGTFTDIIATDPQGKLSSHKLLSVNPDHYDDAVSYGIKLIINQANSSAEVGSIRMGTTVATNALLERNGEPTLLLITQGFRDLLVIRSQHREHLFKQHIIRNRPLYAAVAEVEERLAADGSIRQDLDLAAIESVLQLHYQNGIRSVAICLMHSCANPQHELAIAKIAKQTGYQQISLSHITSPQPKLLPRAETTVADAYLSPILHSYTNRINNRFSDAELLLMQSNGELTTADKFHGKDAVLSGPAGGIVAMARTAQQAGFDKVIGFDMGGTSTDVSLFNGEFNTEIDNQIAGTHIRVPMLAVHTVAAGGGSLLTFDGQVLKVGPESAGAHPGPVSYGKQATSELPKKLAVTDINVLTGKIRPELFPHVFGADANQPLNVDACRDVFEQLTDQINQQSSSQLSPTQVASNFLSIAVNNMANAIKTISTQKGIELDDYALNAFGGAGGQHACLVAEELGIETIFIHNQSSLLSAYGMGCGYQGLEHEIYFGSELSSLIFEQLIPLTDSKFEQQSAELCKSLGEIDNEVVLHCHYEKSDVTLAITLTQAQLNDTKVELIKLVSQAFNIQHQRQFGFTNNDLAIIVRYAQIKTKLVRPLAESQQTQSSKKNKQVYKVWFRDSWQDTDFVHIESIEADDNLIGPCILYSTNTTIVVEPGWQAKKTSAGHFILTQKNKAKKKFKDDLELTPIRLSIFNNLYAYIAEQMGAVLQKTAVSVNIKERLDFSCAVFDKIGNLIANAPHMPVHLGSMSDSVRHIIQHNTQVSDGDSFMLNSPYQGGTHLPDITLVSPVFVDDELLFWVASRGHHADIGGTTPGSMPADSNHIEQEGVIIDNILFTKQHVLQEEQISHLLNDAQYPVRNYQQTLADLKAQLAANQRGINELIKACNEFGSATVSRYMDYVQDQAETTVRQAIRQLTVGEFNYPMDNGAVISLRISRNQDDLVFDFSNTSKQQDSNFNAPLSVTRAAVLYVLRSLIDDDVPLNEGCLRPVTLIVPKESMLNPIYP